MKKLVCHIVDKHREGHIGIDQYIAEHLGWNPSMGSKGMNPYKVAAYRGLFDSNAERNHLAPLIAEDVIDPTEEQLQEALKRFINFKAGTRISQDTAVVSAKKRTAKAYDTLRHVLSLQQRKHRISAISAVVSNKIDILMERHPKVSRQAIVNGIRLSDKNVGGPTALFDDVYQDFLEKRQRYWEYLQSYEDHWRYTKARYEEALKPDAAHPEDRRLLDFDNAPNNAQDWKRLLEQRFNEYTKVIENWESLIPFVMKDLVKREGMKMSIKKEFIGAASIGDFGENHIEDMWDSAEATREGWQRNNDLESAFGSIGAQVRRVLATIYDVEEVPIWETKNGVRKFKGTRTRPIFDDMGFYTFKDPIQVHQYLSDYLKGVKDSEDVIKRLIKPGTDRAKIAWMQPLVDIITSDNSTNKVASLLFVDFKKNFQPYSIMFEDEEKSFGPLRYIKTRVLNRPKNIAAAKYKTLMSSKGTYPVGVKLWGFTPIFQEGREGGKINWERLAELREKVLMWTHEEVPEKAGVFNNLDTYVAPTPSLLLDRRHDTIITVDGKEERLTYEMKRNFLLETFTSLGYDVNIDTIDSILNSSDIYEVRSQLEDLFNPDDQYSGIKFALSGRNSTNFGILTKKKSSKEEKAKALEELNASTLTFRQLYNAKAGSKGDTPVKEHSERLLSIICNHQEGKRIENRVRFQGNTMYSYVNPSYLGDRLEEIENYVEDNDHEGLLKYLTAEYLEDPYFVDNEYLSTNGREGHILNMWLAEMVDACKNTKVPLKDTVAAIFQYERDLGNDSKKFEDFTIKEHGVDMLVHYFADEQQNKGYGGKGFRSINKKLSALYPIFTLGDAGVSKYIRAPRIVTPRRVDREGGLLDEANAKDTYKIVYKFDDRAKERVLDQFYNIYLQERRRMALDNAMVHKLYANGKEVKHSEGEFSILTFLNPTSQEYTSDYEIPIDKETGEPTSDRITIKEIIRKHLENASLNTLKRADGSIIPSFKQRLSDMGLLETTTTAKGKTAYKFLNSIVTPENIDEKISDFYWNTKLATAEQLQLMTIDPSFYASTKELQKRYKEIHAPGSVLDVLAKDSTGKLYSATGIETCAYFSDLRVNAEVTNPEFLESVLRTFAKPGVDVEEAIAAGIIHPKDTPEEETKRQNKLIDILGNETFKKVYKPYMENTLTDGQGYRTLTSYRKVMGMAEKWDESMEAMYDHIMSLREKYTKKGLDIPTEELQRIARFAITLQPIKPYMFTHEKADVYIQKTDGKGNKLTDASGKKIVVKRSRNIPVQHKYAEALIIPELMPKGSQLRDLGLWMDEHEVDLVGSDKICKVGCFGQADISNCKNSTDLVNAMNKAVIHNLSYKDYRIQTNVPEHINGSQLFGTQVRKLIMANLKDGTDYSSYIDGNTVNLSTDGEKNKEVSLQGKNLLALYNSLICANIFDSYDKFKRNVEDIDNVSEMLQQATIGSMRESADNILSYVTVGNEEALKEFMIPLFEGGLEYNAASLLLSTFKRIVNKQQISGGSAVQVSAFGIDGYHTDGNLRYVQDNDNNANILYAEIEIPFDKTSTITAKNADGTASTYTVDLDYHKYCFNDGNMVPSGKPLEKGTKEWKKYQSYTYKEVEGKLVPCKYNDSNAKVYKPLIEEDYPDILSILAYRIPSENDYSMINCQIKRFTSKTAGGTLKVPPQGTTIAGFDFDIDKLYFMQREYSRHHSIASYIEESFNEHDKSTIWGGIYEEYPSLKDALKEARQRAEDKDPTLYKEARSPLSGRIYIRRKSLTPLNLYYDQINGEDITGKSKKDLFAEKAIELGIAPTQNISKKDFIRDSVYDFTKTPEQNSRASRNNLLISLIQARLRDPETMKQRYTPGGFNEAKQTARFLRELIYGNLEGVVNNGIVDISTLKSRQGESTDPEPNFSATDPYTILYYNQQNQLAAKLIGIFANQNTHNAFVSCMDKFELKEAISFCGHNFKDLLHKDSPIAASASLRVAEFLAASVDAVKDPVLNFMNLNTITADSAGLLARLGYSMDEIGLFLSQPVIKDICQESFNTGRAAKTCIIEMKNKLSKYTPTGNKVSLTANDLALGIINDRKTREMGEEHEKFLQENAKIQLAVLETFEKALQASQDVSEFVTNTKFTASNAVGATFGSLYAQQIRVNNYLDRFNKNSNNESSISYDLVVSQTAGRAGVMDKPIDNSSDLITMSSEEYLHYVRFNPFAYEQAMYDSNRKALKLLARYFPYDTEMYKRVRGRMNELCRIGSLGEDEIDEIHRDLPVALLARQKGSEFYGEGLYKVYDPIDGKYKKTDITNRTYYREQFAADLEDILGDHPELKDLAIFKFITTESEEVILGRNSQNNKLIKKEVWTINMQDVGGLESDTKEEIKESWASLMEVDDDGYFKNPLYAELGKGLFMYCFYQMGYKFSPISFMHLAPTAVKDFIKVERENSVPMLPFDEGDIKWDDPDSNDVLVWSANVEGSMERLAGEFDKDRSLIGELQDKTYRLGDVLMKGSIINLINAAISHPELRFKIDRTLTQEEFDLFSLSTLGRDVPANIFFSKATLANVTSESKEAVSYGKNRSYRQFLSDILQGKQNNYDTDDFAKQFILNHLDNAKFVFDVNKGAKNLRNAIKEQAEQSLKIDKNSITFDVSRFVFNNDRDKNAFNTFVRVKEINGRIATAEWSPVILYNGSYYMANSEEADMGFNRNRSTRMTYVKVVPMGTDKVLTYDGNKKMSPARRYQAYYGEADEDLSYAEYKRKVTPAKSEKKEEETGKDNDSITLTPEANGSEVSLENRDFSDIATILSKMATKVEVADDVWKSISDTLADLDLRNQVLNTSEPLNDDTYDSVEGLMQDTLGMRGWRKIPQDLKKSLVKAVFEYNKNPKYLTPESPLEEGPLDGPKEQGTLSEDMRARYENLIVAEYIDAIDSNGERLSKNAIDKVQGSLAYTSDADIRRMVDMIRKSCRENGCMMLNEEGLPQLGC